MKKIISFLLLLCSSCVLLFGCGQTKEETNTTNEETATRNIQLSGVEFDIPENWTDAEIAKNESADSVKCFQSEDIWLKVIYGSNSVSDGTDKDYEAYLTGVGTRIKNFQFENIEKDKYSGNPIKKASITFTVGTDSYTGTVFTFDFANFIFGVKDSSSTGRDKDIIKVLETVKEIEYEKKPDKNINYLLLSSDMRWNMAKAETEDLETREPNLTGSISNGNMSYLNYNLNSDTDKYSSSGSSVYAFMDDKLKAYWTTFDSPSFSDYKGVYEEIKSFLSQKYGDCESENINWSDTTYQNNEEKWNEAFEYGYVTIKTIWHTDDSAIIIDWDYKNNMKIITSSLDFENSL